MAFRFRVQSQKPSSSSWLCIIATYDCVGPYASIGQVESHCVKQKRCNFKYSAYGFTGYEAVPGKLPAFWDNELMMGMKMPPALAVVEGMAGAIAASANASPYARPSVLLPKAFTNKVATRSPRPVFSKPCRRPGLTWQACCCCCCCSPAGVVNQALNDAGLAADKGPKADTG